MPLAVLLRYREAEPRTAFFLAALIALVSIPGDSLDALFGFLVRRVGTVPAWLATSLPTFALVAALAALTRTKAPAAD